MNGIFGESTSSLTVLVWRECYFPVRSFTKCSMHRFASLVCLDFPALVYGSPLSLWALIGLCDFLRLFMNGLQCFRCFFPCFFQSKMYLRKTKNRNKIAWFVFRAVMCLTASRNRDFTSSFLSVLIKFNNYWFYFECSGVILLEKVCQFTHRHCSILFSPKYFTQKSWNQ